MEVTVLTILQFQLRLIRITFQCLFVNIQSHLKSRWYVGRQLVGLCRLPYDNQDD